MRVFVAGGSGAIGRRAPWCARCTLSGFHLQVGTSAIGLRIRVHVLGLDSAEAASSQAALPPRTMVGWGT